MENEDKTKANILKEVNKKLKNRGIKIAVISIIVCILVGVITYLILFVKTTPWDVNLFKDIKIEMKTETINQISREERPYNHLTFTLEDDNYSIMNSDMHYYVENDSKNKTSTLYFYFTQSYMQKIQTEQMKNESDEFFINQGYSNDFINEPTKTDILLSTALCKTNTGYINEITKVYYLVYDYNNINQEKFDKEKGKAMLLWEK